MKFSLNWKCWPEKNLTEKEMRLPLFLALAGVIIGISLYIQDLRICELKQGNLLERPLVGEGRLEEELQVRVWSESLGQQQIQISVDEQKLTEEEIRERLEKAADQIRVLILGENPSLDQVRTPLNLIQEIEGTPILVEWEFPEEGLLQRDGSWEQQELPQDGVLTELTARLWWEEELLVVPLYVRIYPEDLTEEEAFLKILQKSIEEKNQSSEYETYQELPKEAAGMTLEWKRPRKLRGIYLMLLALVGAALQVLTKRKEQQKQAEKKRKQMEMDYPEVVSKLKLYLEAGLTCRAAWIKIAGDYEKKQRKGCAKYRHIYEEMVKTGYEMQSGVSELKAYERFAERCGVSCYKKLTGLLIQNIRKGNRGLGTLLEAEMWQAFENRKALAKKQGEEAGTKLLLPMIGMLVVVMVIVIAPALMSMQI